MGLGGSRWRTDQKKKKIQNEEGKKGNLESVILEEDKSKKIKEGKWKGREHGTVGVSGREGKGGILRLGKGVEIGRNGQKLWEGGIS